MHVTGVQADAATATQECCGRPHTVSGTLSSTCTSTPPVPAAARTELAHVLSSARTPVGRAAIATRPARSRWRSSLTRAPHPDTHPTARVARAPAHVVRHTDQEVDTGADRLQLRAQLCGPQGTLEARLDAAPDPVERVPHLVTCDAGMPHTTPRPPKHCPAAGAHAQMYPKLRSKRAIDSFATRSRSAPAASAERDPCRFTETRKSCRIRLSCAPVSGNHTRIPHMMRTHGAPHTTSAHKAHLHVCLHDSEDT